MASTDSLTHKHKYMAFSLVQYYKKKIFLYKLATIVINAVLLDMMILKNVYFIFSMLK